MRIPSRYLTAILNLLFLCILSSCVAGVGGSHVKVASGYLLDKSKIALIKPGITTLSDILAWFGPPHYIIDESHKILEQQPTPSQYLLTGLEFAESFPTRVLTAPDEMFLLIYVYGEKDFVFHYAHVAGAGAGSIDVKYKDKEFFIYLSKKDRTVVTTAGNIPIEGDYE